ncbi:MAG TPA: inorganic diphosphatase [Nitrososphaeraceae archaeon]|jgi:inorganic pyrophosphatase|nr:inorganic diphosphatase [Nitrososphaeraceae archaeon]
MNFIEQLNTGKYPPEDINVVIEIPKGSNIKYEYDLDNGILYVDRILSVEMVYPFNYGFIPKTIETLDDNSNNIDSLDVFVIDFDSLQPLSVINCTPIGVILTEDQDGVDSKIIATPIPKIMNYNNLMDLNDVNPYYINKLKHFIEHHKDLEKEKFVKIKELGDKTKAKGIILDAIENYKKYKKNK